MKHTLRIISLLFIFFSCDESRVKVYNLNDEDFSSSKLDSMIINVDKEGMPLEFTGTLKLYNGECKIVLITPIPDTSYKEIPYLRYDTIYKIDSIFFVDSLSVFDTVFSVESIEFRDTIFLIDTILKYTDTIYYKSFREPDAYDFDEEFDRIIGNWRFYYKLAPIDKVSPEGSLDFTIKYED